jgi:hypothetical protein
MKCVAHLWRSIDCDGNQFILCLSPVYSFKGGAPTEAFSCESSLSRRLDDVGFDADSIRMGLSKLRHRKNSTWANIEVPAGVFELFGAG